MNNIIDLKTIDFDLPLNQIIQKNILPVKFQYCSFQNYIPDNNYPSQEEVKSQLLEFVSNLKHYNTKKSYHLFNIFKKRNKPNNVYLDGKFGVGKTHLLAAIGNTYDKLTSFISFTSLMYLIARFNTKYVVNQFSQFDMILLDEFELDNPGDAMMGINFIREINKTNTVIVVTSNTTPSELGGRNLDIELFKDRLGMLKDSFCLYLIEGKDYRLKLKQQICFEKKNELKNLFYHYKTNKRKKMYITYEKLMSFLSSVDPTRFIRFNSIIDAIFIENLKRFTEDELLDAIRFTYLIDMLYYGNVDIFISSNVDLMSIFSNELKDGNFKNKMLRCVSRISEKGTFIHV